MYSCGLLEHCSSLTLVQFSNSGLSRFPMIILSPMASVSIYKQNNFFVLFNMHLKAYNFDHASLWISSLYFGVIFCDLVSKEWFWFLSMCSYIWIPSLALCPCSNPTCLCTMGTNSHAAYYCDQNIFTLPLHIRFHLIFNSKLPHSAFWESHLLRWFFFKLTKFVTSKPSKLH